LGRKERFLKRCPNYKEGRDLSNHASSNNLDQWGSLGSPQIKV